MSENQVASTSEKRDAGLNEILRANIDKAEKPAEERRSKRERKASEASESDARKPAKEEPKAKGSEDGDGASQRKEADEGKKAKSEKPDAEKSDRTDKAENEGGKPSEDAETVEKSGKTENETERTDAEKPKPKKDAKDSKDIDPDKPFAPKTWTEEERAAFEEAPPHVQQAVTRLVKNLQAGFTKKTMALADAQRVAEDVSSVIQPHHRAKMKELGISEGKMLSQLLAWQDAYTSDPVRTIHGLMQNARLTPEHLGFGAARQQAEAQPEEGQAQADPQVAQLQAELNALKNVWTQATHSAQQRQVQEQQRTLTDAQTAIQQFASAVDETGNQLHPHFEKVWARMLPAINELNTDPERSKLPHQEKLKIAYEDAIWADPDYRRQHQAAEQRRIEAKLAAAQKEARDKALEEAEKQRARSAVSVKPKIGSGTNIGGKDRKLSLDEILQANANKFGL